MITAQMRITIWTRKAVGKQLIANQFLETLSELLPEAFPPRWGEADPLTVKASAENFSTLIPLWSETLREAGDSLLGFGRGSGLSIDYMSGPTHQPHTVWFYFPLKIINRGNGLHRSLELVSRWISILDADFARYCTEAERIAKNVFHQYRERDGSYTPRKVFGTEITKGLPGVFWSTYFGPDVTKWIGDDKLASSPWPYVEKVGSGYLLRRSGHPEEWEKETKQDQALIAHLGRGYFFDVKFPNRRLKQLPLSLPEEK